MKYGSIPPVTFTDSLTLMPTLIITASIEPNCETFSSVIPSENLQIANPQTVYFENINFIRTMLHPYYGNSAYSYSRFRYFHFYLFTDFYLKT